MVGLCGTVATTVTGSTIPVPLSQTAVLASQLFSIPEVSPAQDSQGWPQHPHDSGACEKRTSWSQTPCSPAVLSLKKVPWLNHSLRPGPMTTSPHQALRAGEAHCPCSQALSPATLLTRLRSPGHHSISLPSLLQVRETWGPLQEEAAWFPPAPPMLLRFSPHPSLQLCLWIGSCFLRFQEGAGVSTAR